MRIMQPCCTLVTHGDITAVTREGVSTASTEDPLALLQRELDAMQLAPPCNADLPFTGGALGLFGYDLGRRFETLPSQAEQDLALPDMAVGLYDWALIVDHHQQKVTLLRLLSG
ncbi:MAG: aminodeoxychorismate synthase, component [Enterobacter kobei]|nr:aminodeoxychorismate synthase, component [Enterobacter kobei]